MADDDDPRLNPSGAIAPGLSIGHERRSIALQTAAMIARARQTLRPVHHVHRRWPELRHHHSTLLIGPVVACPPLRAAPFTPYRNTTDPSDCPDSALGLGAFFIPSGIAPKGKVRWKVINRRRTRGMVFHKIVKGDAGSIVEASIQSNNP